MLVIRGISTRDHELRRRREEAEASGRRGGAREALRQGVVVVSQRSDASEGKPGLIPGSMGTAAYVATGRGQPARPFTRRHAGAFLEEIPAAYKPIDQVMANAADLAEIRPTLRQIVKVTGE